MADEEPTVMQLIDAELKRLREPMEARRFSYAYPFRPHVRKAWLEGIRVARQVSAERLQKVRDAYMAEPPKDDDESWRSSWIGG